MPISKRYSDEAIIKNRRNNCIRFLEQAKAKYGERFDYSHVEFISQNIPVTIGCPDHGWIEIVPDKHLRSEFGCSQCGVEARGRRKSEHTKKTFLDNFKKKYSHRLKLLTEYQGA